MGSTASSWPINPWSGQVTMFSSMAPFKKNVFHVVHKKITRNIYVLKKKKIHILTNSEFLLISASLHCSSHTRTQVVWTGEASVQLQETESPQWADGPQRRLRAHRAPIHPVPAAARTRPKDRPPHSLPLARSRGRKALRQEQHMLIKLSACLTQSTKSAVFVSSQWPVEHEAPKHKSQPPLSFGLILRPELATSVLERGPPADSPKVSRPPCFSVC